jgi:hypothetical protein
MVSRKLMLGLTSVAALTLSGVGAAVVAPAHASTHVRNKASAEHNPATTAAVLQRLLVRMPSSKVQEQPSLSPEVDQSQGCVYRVDHFNIFLHASPEAGSPDISITSFDDVMVSAPLDETGSGWEYVMDVGSSQTGALYGMPSGSGWIGKQFMAFVGCSGPKYGNVPDANSTRS